MTVADDRASRTSGGALGSRDNWVRKCAPTPPTPIFDGLGFSLCFISRF